MSLSRTRAHAKYIRVLEGHVNLNSIHSRSRCSYVCEYKARVVVEHVFVASWD